MQTVRVSAAVSAFSGVAMDGVLQWLVGDGSLAKPKCTGTPSLVLKADRAVHSEARHHILLSL